MRFRLLRTAGSEYFPARVGLFQANDCSRNGRMALLRSQVRIRGSHDCTIISRSYCVLSRCVVAKWHAGATLPTFCDRAFGDETEERRRHLTLGMAANPRSQVANGHSRPM